MSAVVELAARTRSDRRAAGDLVGAWLRRAGWRFVLVLTGGIAVTGRLPAGGCVVVANHTSHADTAALLAAIDPGHRPRVAAAADYWFSTGVRAAVCNLLVGGFAVRRDGGGSVDLAGAAALLRGGHAVVVFPEGTRGDGLGIGPFHSGAARLAASAGVPLVPVGLAGTADLLPAHGRFRAAPVAVHIGGPIARPGPAHATASSDVARNAVGEAVERARRSLESGRPDSTARRRVARVVSGPLGLLLIGAWAFLEGVSWPVVPEVALLVALLAAPRRWCVLVPLAVLANLAGGLVTYALVTAGVDPPQPLVTEAMRSTVVAQTVSDGARAVRHQPMAGIPFKVYVAEAARHQVEPVELAAESALARGRRITLLGVCFGALGHLIQRRPQAYPLVVVPALGGFAAGLALVVSGWS
ncbi:MAG: lysophospholipid acyltransferase family protein [Actinomycetes bacterium]